MPKKPRKPKSSKPANKSKPTTKAKPKPSKPAAPTKLSRVIQLCESKTGTTLDAIAAELKISRTAAASLIGDARARGIKIGRDAEGRYCGAG